MRADLRSQTMALQRALGDVLPNDPNPCAPILHPFNDPPPLAKWLPWIAIGIAAVMVVRGTRS